jgi:uncharacterized protein
MNILAEIVSSKVRAEIFRLLFGVNLQEFHLREIERRTGFAIGTVKQETSKLVKTGLIKKRQDGNRTYFRADASHPLFPDIRNLVLKSVGLADTLKNALSDPAIHFAFVFGSLANGAEKAESDVDLFVIGDISLRGLSKVLKEPRAVIGREINAHAMGEKEFIDRKRQKEHFISRVLDSPKLMIVGTEDELKGLGE